MKVVDRIREWLDRDKSVRMVADDIQVTSELILLIRMIFADGELKPEEMEMFRRICSKVFSIPEDDVTDVVKYLQDIGYETSAGDAARMFEELDIDRRRNLLLHMFRIAKADNELDAKEVDMIKKTAGILQLGPEEIRQISQ